MKLVRATTIAVSSHRHDKIGKVPSAGADSGKAIPLQLPEAGGLLRPTFLPGHLLTEERHRRDGHLG